MEAIMLIVSSILVTVVTAGVKKLKKVKHSEKRKPILKLLVAVFSFAAVATGALLSGGEVEPLAIETFVNAVVVFFGSTGVYFSTKKKKE